MTKGMKEKGLLDILAEKSGCMYLSDLAGTGTSRFLPHHLWEIDADSFGLWEWEDAVLYLTGQKVSFDTPEQARKYLMEYSLKE